jgi:tetratricopeptide (TPR) repeat protein
MPESKTIVMISSTALDLPEHRQQVMDACLRQGMFPVMMEHMTAANAGALDESLRMVDVADIYLGVFAFRYGTVPKGQSISITEAEYNRAEERGIPRLIFLMGEDHDIKPGDVETGKGATALKRLKKRLKEPQVVGSFDSPTDLRAKAIQALSQYRESDTTVFHYVSDIPQAPEKYIAHPYTLLQTHGLIGRQEELELLTDWVAKPDSDVYKAHILSIVAIGGMGKSALTWKWFNDIAPAEMKPLAGRIWWSFYESDATFENFIIRALAYVSQIPMAEIQQVPAPERESRLLTILDREHFLIVLDGLERLLIAYARMDANRLEDSKVGTDRKLRKTADPRVGQFLRKLAQVQTSRVLISTRLHAVELENDGGESRPGTYKRALEGLIETDAVDLWRSFGVTGSRDLLLPIFDAFGRHPLLIQALAGEVKRYRTAPGDFEKWREANAQFSPAGFPELKDRMVHALEFALRGLIGKTEKVLQTIAAFRMPSQYDTLVALLVGKERPCLDEGELDAMLTELEDRGLIGWDTRANRYDLHPIVRGVVWSNLSDDARQGVYNQLLNHFQSVPMIADFLKIDALDDLTPAVELFNILIGMKRYDHAGQIFYELLSNAMLYRLSASRQQVELLEMLLPDSRDEWPRLSDRGNHAWILSTLALGYQFSGRPGRAVRLFSENISIRSEIGPERDLSTGHSNLSDVFRDTGDLHESEMEARLSLVIARGLDDKFDEAASLLTLGSLLSPRGDTDGSELALRRSLRIFALQKQGQGRGVASSFLAQSRIWLGDYNGALSFASQAWELAHLGKAERDFIRALRLLGEILLWLKDPVKAEECLHRALIRARTVNLVDEELQTLNALAELGHQQEDEQAARDFLDHGWEYAERGPYPLFHADALNILAQIERDAGNTDKAIEAATKAYQLAWCDGPPYAYHWGLIKAQKHLEELGAPLPEMPPFDESKYEPMPEVEINPKDEFHHGTNREEADPTSKSTKKGRQKGKKRGK